MINLRLDPNFQPMILKLREFKARVAESESKVPVAFCVERNNGYKYRYDIDVIPGDAEAIGVIERLIKSVLWVVGGFKVYFGGDRQLGEELKKHFTKGGARDFDVNFMAQVYDNPFEFVVVDYKDVPENKASSISVGGNLEGCRIGFDAGGSDRKVSAVVDGEVIYSEEVVPGTDPSQLPGTTQDTLRLSGIKGKHHESCPVSPPRLCEDPHPHRVPAQLLQGSRRQGERLHQA